VCNCFEFSKKHFVGDEVGSIIDKTICVVEPGDGGSDDPFFQSVMS
jgi:hypothetical protein